MFTRCLDSRKKCEHACKNPSDICHYHTNIYMYACYSYTRSWWHHAPQSSPAWKPLDSARCVRHQSCLFLLVRRSRQEILLPPFLSDEAAYLGAPFRLSFRPKAIKWHESDSLDCGCLRVKHSKPLLKTTASLSHIYTHVYTFTCTTPTQLFGDAYTARENSQLMSNQAWSDCVLDHD